jgi:hypothetical protein
MATNTQTATEIESHGQLTCYAATPQEYKDAIDAAETLGLSLAGVEAVKSNAFKVHESESFDSWNANATHQDYTVTPGRKWFKVKIADEEPFKVRGPGYHDRTPKFRLEFHS